MSASSGAAKDSAAQFVAKQSQKYPQFASHYDKFADLYSRRLYHQLTLALRSFIFNDETFVDDNMIKLYVNFISKFEKSLNRIELSRLIVRISKQFSNLEDALKFLDKICIDGKPTKQGGTGLFEEESVSWMIIQCEIGHIYLIGNLIKQCKEIIDRMADLMHGNKHYYNHSALYQQYYRISLQYFKVIGAPQEYLDAALKFLTHTKPNDLPQKEQLLFASDICLAALLSTKCYDFSVLLSHQLIELLQKTEFDWLYQIIFMFNTGDLKAWKTYCLQHEKLLKNHETISHNLAFLEQKIRLMALIELIFQTPPNQRLLTFDTISMQCELQMDEVELVLIRAMSLKLIKGIIDEIDRTVLVTYCEPRSLQMSQIKDMKEKVQGWIGKVGQCETDINQQMSSHHLLQEST